jgi:hypothetical protein
MASQPQDTGLPLFYRELEPLNSGRHSNWVMTPRDKFPYAVGANAIPVTVDEFMMVQRHYPIVFGPGENGAPLALLGLSDGENLFVDAEGRWEPGVYVPAYVRRYPFLLAKLTPDAKDLSLCMDPTSDVFGTEGTPNLFDGEGPSETTRNVLQFCEQFELAINRTRAFMTEIKELDVLQEGEATITLNNTPMTMRGFRMMQEQKIQDLRGDQARKLVRNGVLGLIYAHLFSLSTMRELVERKAARSQQA